MKKIKNLAIILLMTTIIMILNVKVEAKTGIINVDTVRLRAEASTDSDIVEQIRYSTQRHFYSDDLSQVLLYLGGISCKDYDEKCNIISPSYNNHRKRLLKKNTDYDKIIQ